MSDRRHQGGVDPAAEIRLVGLSTLRGANFWSARPVTRLDVAVGAYDEISSAEVPGLPDALLAAMPGLIEHRCSVGERGGFLTRLRRGTYAPHIMEHVALELQGMMGHAVGFGRARGGDRPGEYTVVFEHLHGEVGLRAAALAVDLVQQAFAGTLGGAGEAVAELEALAAGEDLPRPARRVLCAITGSGDRAGVRAELQRRGVGRRGEVVELSPGYLLNAGLPYAESHVAIIIGVEPADVPPRYRESGLALRLLSVVADGVPRGGSVVVPEGVPELHEMIVDAGRRVVLFDASSPRGDDSAAGRAAAALAETTLPRP